MEIGPNDIVFMPKPRIKSLDFGEFRVDGDKIVGSLIVEVYKPDPKQCGIIRNVGRTDGTDTK